MNKITVVANVAFAIIALWYFFYNRAAAVGTKIHESLRMWSELSIMH